MIRIHHCRRANPFDAVRHRGILHARIPMSTPIQRIHIFSSRVRIIACVVPLTLIFLGCEKHSPIYTMLLSEGDVTIDSKVRKNSVGASLPPSVLIGSAGTAVFRHDGVALVSLENASVRYTHRNIHGSNIIHAALARGNAAFRIRPREANESFTVTCDGLPLVIDAFGGTFAVSITSTVDVLCLAGTFEITDGTNRRTMLPGRSLRWPTGESITNGALLERMNGIRMLSLASMRGERVFRITGDEGISIASSSGTLGKVPLSLLVNPAGINLIASAPGKLSARISLAAAQTIPVTLKPEFSSIGRRRFPVGIASLSPAPHAGRFIIADNAGSIHALDTSLSNRWSRRIGVVAGMCVEDDAVIALTTGEKTYIHTISLSNGYPLAVTAAPYAPSYPPCRMGDMLFYLSATGDGFFHSLKDHSVIPVRLGRKTPLPPVSDTSHVYIIDAKGVLLVIDAVSAKPRELTSLAGKFSIPAVIHGKHITAVSDAGIAHRVDTASGAIVQWYTVPKGLTLIAEGGVIFGCSRGVLRLGEKPETVFMPMHEAMRSKPLGDMFAAFTMTGIDLYSPAGDRIEGITLGTFASEIERSGDMLVIRTDDSIHLYR